MKPFAMDRRFYTRLQTLYRSPSAKANELRERTAEIRKSKGFEVPKACDENMEVV